MPRHPLLAVLLIQLCFPSFAAGGVRFDISEIHVEGNTLLTDQQLTDFMMQSLRLVGKNRGIEDLGRARDALELAYTTAGIPGVEVSIQEAALAAGVVMFQVAEFNDRNASVHPDNPLPKAIETIGTMPAPAEKADDQPTDDERFNISAFRIEGNTLLAIADVDNLVTPFTGEKRVYGDIQRALEAVESAYRAAGYNTVQVFVPEQELSEGIVKLQVTEAVIGKVTVSGNTHFSEANVRAGLPALQEGLAPNARQLSKNIQLSNDNPAKQVEVTLGVSEDEGKIDAKIAVTEDRPLKYSITLDNTGSSSTGKHRSGFAAQYANLFDRDHMLTLAYTTSPDAPKGVNVNIFSFAYRMPLYGLGDSLDLVYGKSSVNTPSVQSTGFGLTGKGDVMSFRYNHYLARRGEYSGKFALGFDYKYFNTRCSINGIPQSFEPPVPAIASCTPHTSRPVSASYTGQWQGPASMYDYNVSLSRNVPIGSKYLFNDGMDRYSLIANRLVAERFTVLRYGGSYLTAILTDWQIRMALSGQYTSTGLIGGEQFGLAGASAVRGFSERAVAGDTGQMLNLEAYSPELAKELGVPGSLRGVLFFDISHGRNIGVAAPSPTTAESVGAAAAGVGLRYNVGKDINVRADVGKVTKAGTLGAEVRGDWRGHFNMLLNL